MSQNSNALFCKNCKTIIVSFHRHDFVWCSCESEETRVAVDGGKDYSKRCFGPKSQWIESNGEECP